jgi:hypothetical protein
MTPLHLDSTASGQSVLQARIAHAQATDNNDVTLFLQQETEESLDVARLGSLTGLWRRLPNLVGEAHQLRPSPAAGIVARQFVTLHGAREETHQLRALVPGGWQETISLLARRDGATAAHVEITNRNLGELPGLVRLLQERKVTDLLVSDFQARRDDEGALKPSSEEVLRGLDRLWHAAVGSSVRILLLGFGRERHANAAAEAPAAPADDNLLGFLRQGIRLPSIRPGVPELGHVSSGPAGTAINAGFELAALESPVLNLPPCLGGALAVLPPAQAIGIKSSACPTCVVDDRCPGASPALRLSSPATDLRPLPLWHSWRRDPKPQKILILSPQGEDPTLYCSTLPGLAEALRRRGAEVEIVSPWLTYWTPGPMTPLRFERRRPTFPGFTGVEQWLRDHDLSGFDLIVAADPETGARVLSAGTFPKDGRLVVVDFHMLRGVEKLRTDQGSSGRAEEGRWWPSERAALVSGFPGYVHLYLRQGVPLRQISWRPVSLCASNFPEGQDPTTCRMIMSGGNHCRDMETISAAARMLPAEVHELHWYSDRKFQSGPHVRYKGSVMLPRFHRAMMRSRFVVIPMTEDRHRAAGITVLVEAFMTGRPVIASSIPAARDYVRHDIDGLLVPPGDAKALAEAITRLDTEPGLLARLSEGARRSAWTMSTEAWAEEIVTGRGLRLPVPDAQGWHAW